MVPKKVIGVFLLAMAAPAAVTEDQCLDLLRHALQARNPDTRKQAAVALSLSSESSPLMTLLENMLDDKDVQVRIAVVTSLSEVKEQGATVALHKALQDEVPEVSFAAAKALFTRNDPDGRQALLAVLEKESKSSSGFLTQQKRDALRMMYTPRTTFLYAVRQGMGFVPIPGFGEGIASMQGILSDPGVSGRATAALLLSRDKNPGTEAALKDALYDKDWHVRAAAVHSLSVRNDPAVKKDLEPVLEDDREEVRLRAAAGWLRLSAIKVVRKPRKK
jgi:HEAT repeat protein